MNYTPLGKEDEKNLKENVKKTEKGLFKQKKKFLGIFPLQKEEDVSKEKLIKLQPLLLYIKEDFTADIYEHVKPGYIKPDKSKEFTHEIQSRKRIDLHYKGTKIPLYILYEQERFCYPTDPKFDAQAITRSLRNIKQNYKDYDERINPLKGLSIPTLKKIAIIIAIILGAVIGGLYVGNILGVWELLGWFQNTGVNTISNVGSNVINNTLPNGGAIIMP